MVIAAVIAIGSGVYAGLGSTAAWRRMSNDASFAALNMHDLRVELSPGSTVAEGQLAARTAGLEHARWIRRADERLVATTQVDTTTKGPQPGSAVLVRGRVVGMDLYDTASVDALSIDTGARPRMATAATLGRATTTLAAAQVVLESKFADHHKLPSTGELTVAGGQSVRYSGTGVTPEYFLVTGSSVGGFLAAANYAVLFTSLPDAQRLTGQVGKVNDLVLTLTPDADRAVVAAELEASMKAFAGVSATVSTKDDDPSYRLLYDDIDGDQKLWNVLSLLILAASAIAAFNLISRIVEAQRREIGVQMALGVPPRRLAMRPLLIGAQIALLGAIFGVAVGLVVGRSMRSLLVSVLPLPIWQTPFQARTFAAAASLGFVIPFVASVYPVWRAVRVEPIEAIRTGNLTASPGMARFARWIRIPGNSLTQLPLRNLLRTPRRTILTAIGVGSAIAALVGTFGLLDSFVKTINEGENEITASAPDRVVLDLGGFHAVDSPIITGPVGIAASPAVRSVDPRVEIPATLLAPGRDDVAIVVSSVDFERGQWQPRMIDTVADRGRPGVVVSRVAASDLGVSPGEPITMKHPRREGLAGYRMVESTFTVVGLHANPLRSLAYVRLQELRTFGLEGLANVVDVRPAKGVTDRQLQRAMFAQNGVASAQPVAALTDLFRDALDQFVGILVIAGVAVLVLALLIAFNTTSVAIDERARHHATLFAFGIRVRRVVGLIVKESVIIGVAATLFGVVLGYVLVRWMVFSLLRETVPAIGIMLSISTRTMLVALIVGVLAVGLTPLLLVGRLLRMDIPDTLRVME